MDVEGLFQKPGPNEPQHRSISTTYAPRLQKHHGVRSVSSPSALYLFSKKATHCSNAQPRTLSVLVSQIPSVDCSFVVSTVWRHSRDEGELTSQNGTRDSQKGTQSWALYSSKSNVGATPAAVMR